MTTLSREDMMEAFTNGVRAALADGSEDGSSFILPEMEREEVALAIRQGVADAFWRIATNATQMPCRDFYDFIKDGVAEGIERVGGKAL